MNYDAHKLPVDLSLKPKHTKKDYLKMDKMRAGDVIMSATNGETKKVVYQEDIQS